MFAQIELIAFRSTLAYADDIQMMTKLTDMDYKPIWTCFSSYSQLNISLTFATKNRCVNFKMCLGARVQNKSL